ncbi:MAG: hypothetical protein ACYDAC_12770, partial [Candidatus Dormibacteria bacterium]
PWRRAAEVDVVTRDGDTPPEDPSDVFCLSLGEEEDEKDALVFAKPAPPRLPVVSAQRRMTATRLWPAWRRVSTWEDRSDAELGEPLGSLIVTLWAIRIGSHLGSEATTVYNHLLDAELEPTFSDTLMEEVSVFAFALGASWAASRGEGGGS